MGDGFVQAGHAVHDSGFEFSVQPAAVADGRRDVVADAFDAAVAGDGPGATEAAALHAADVPGVPVQLFGRPGAVHDGEHVVERVANDADQKLERPGGGGNGRRAESESGIDASFKIEKIVLCPRTPKKYSKSSSARWGSPRPWRNTPWTVT